MKFELIVKKITKELSTSEKAIFDEWYKSSSKHRAYYAKVKNNYLKETKPVATDVAWKVVNSKLNNKQKRSYLKLAIAVSIMGIIAISSLFQLLNHDQNSSNVNSITASPIEIGTHKAILTLENGTDVVLTNNKFQNNYIKSNGSEIIYAPLSSKSTNENVAYNYLTIPRGGEFFVKLSDGTKVWLNSDSKLKYPVRFTGNIREVELVYGEAYFEVSPSTMHNGKNFSVLTQNQVVEVMGTEFNVKAYKEDDVISTTLVEGKVTLTISETREQEYLIPNQQAVFNPETNKISIQYVDTENLIAWKNGILKFKNKSLEEIMQALSRWYALEVTFEDETIKNRKFNGIFRKRQKIENILESIEKTQEAAFRVEGRKITVGNYPKK